VFFNHSAGALSPSLPQTRCSIAHLFIIVQCWDLASCFRTAELLASYFFLNLCTLWSWIKISWQSVLRHVCWCNAIWLCCVCLLISKNCWVMKHYSVWIIHEMHPHSDLWRDTHTVVNSCAAELAGVSVALQ